MSSVSSNQQSMTAIFLDIDGVMISGMADVEHKNSIEKKREELFPNPVDPWVERFYAKAHLFSGKAINNLNDLIEKASELGEVGIILSSTWRHLGTIEHIKTNVFGHLSFSKYLISKTFIRKYFAIRPDESDHSAQKYGFELNNRGKQIDYWLRENTDKFNIQRMVVLDDYAVGLKERYPDYYVKINNVFNLIEYEKAVGIITKSSFSKLNFPTEETVKMNLNEMIKKGYVEDNKFNEYV